MNKLFYIGLGIILMFVTPTRVLAQNVSVNNGGAQPDASAMLDVSSTSSGLLAPRMTITQRNAITNPATGLLIYQTNVDSGFYYNIGIPAAPNWLKLVSPNDIFGSIADSDGDTRVETEQTANDNTLRFFNSGAQNMTLDPSGNVGIGTTVPNAPLQFSNTLVNRKLVLFEAADNEHEFFGFGVNGGSLRYQVNSPGDHIFYSSSSPTTSTELMRIGGTGNVGIGTTTPAFRLDVNGTSRLSNLRINTNSLQFGAALEVNTRANIIGASNPNLFIGPNGTNYMQAMYNTTGNYGLLFTPGARNIILDPGGFVGIATTTPTFTLTVNGLAAKPGGGTWIATSDIRLKDNIKEYSKGLRELMLLNSIEYSYKENNARGHDPKIVYQGFSAQAVQKVFPEAVIESEDGYLSLDMNAILISYLNAIKELNQKISLLEEKLESVGGENSTPEK